MVDTHKNQIAIKMFSDNVMVGLLGKLLQRAHLYKAEGLMDGSIKYGILEEILCG